MGFSRCTNTLVALWTREATQVNNATMISTAKLIVILFGICQGASYSLRELGSISISHPGFMTVGHNSSERNATRSQRLLLSRFNGIPFSSDYVTLIPEIGAYMDKNIEDVQKVDISSNLKWPNEVKAIPDEVFQRPNMIIAPSGFLVPTKGNGALTIYDLSDTVNSPYQITNTEEEWFYHRVVWMDMDNDGRFDAVTCRAQKPIFGSEKGELVWLRQPDGDMSWTGDWVETILSEGAGAPDTFLISIKLNDNDDDTTQALVTAGFFSKSLDIWWRRDETKPWTSDNLNKRQLDNTEGPVFDFVYADLNGDKTSELLVSYNKPKNGTLFVYEFPGDIRSATPKKHLILQGINPASSGIGKGAPGSMELTRPYKSTDAESEPPLIILSGDDSGQLFALNLTDSSKWKYDVMLLLDVRPGTVGEVAVGDFNQDGYTDMAVPCYNENQIKILTYKPVNRKAVSMGLLAWFCRYLLFGLC